MIGLLFRSSGGSPGKAFASLKAPEARSVFFGSIGILFAAAAVWFAGALVLSFLHAWMVVVLTAALAAAVYVRGRAGRQRQEWVDVGCCAECGFDLRAAPSTVCPDCGRDSTLDEPVWRRLQREHAAKYGRPDLDAAANAQLDDATIRRLLARADLTDMD